MHTKRKRGQNTSSTFLRYRQTPVLHKLVNAHAFQRELSTFTLAAFLNILPIFKNKNLKVDVHPICPFQLFLSQPIGILVVKGFDITICKKHLPIILVPAVIHHNSYIHQQTCYTSCDQKINKIHNSYRDLDSRFFCFILVLLLQIRWQR